MRICIIGGKPILQPGCDAIYVQYPFSNEDIYVLFLELMPDSFFQGQLKIKSHF